MQRPRHQPVLVAEALRYLAPERGGCFVDCTLGLGGHAEALLESHPAARLVGIDRDRRAIARAEERLAPFSDRVRFLCGRFGELESLLGAAEIGKVDGLLADLGVSSMQLDTADRGFSFQRDGPLDMRMGDGDWTAEEIVNSYPEEALSKIMWEYGEERQSRRIARAIVRRRAESPIESTEELCRVIEKAKTFPPGRRPRIHPATQTFQALRIEVNRELDELKDLLDQSSRMLESKGRLVVISYHSLEDRIVKNVLRDLAMGEIEPIMGRPRSETQLIEVLTRKPLRPSEEEVKANPRARSARLRAARRL